MTYLELCRELQTLAGGSGQAIVSVTNQSGEVARFISFVRRAWEEIQIERTNWAFMWQEFSLPLAAGNDSYALNPNGETQPALLAPGPMQYTRANGQRGAIQVLHHQLLVDRLAGVTPDAGLPNSMALAPDGKIKFDRPLSEPITLIGRYYRQPQSLKLDADVPMLPTRYQMVIVYRALKKYADFEEAPYLRSVADANEMPWHHAMVREQLPQIVVGATPLEGSGGGYGGFGLGFGNL